MPTRKSKRDLAPKEIYKKGRIVEVKGDQIGGGSQYALYWFRGKIAKVQGRGAKVKYDVKIEDPTRFNQKSLTVRNLPPRYVRVDAPKAKEISKKKRSESKGGGGGKGGPYAAAGDGGACESWAETLAREERERKIAAGEDPDADGGGGGDAPRQDNPEMESKLEKYQKGKDIRYKVDEKKGDGWKLVDRYTLEFGEHTFKANGHVKCRGQVFTIKRVRIYKERPVLMIENDKNPIRREECKDCVPYTPPEPEVKEVEEVEIYYNYKESKSRRASGEDVAEKKEAEAPAPAPAAQDVPAGGPNDQLTLDEPAAAG